MKVIKTLTAEEEAIHNWFETLPDRARDKIRFMRSEDALGYLEGAMEGLDNIRDELTIGTSL